MKPIAHVHSPFGEKFGIPRQSGLAGKVRAQIIFEPEFRNPDALRGLEGFDYIWILWEFSGNGPRWEPTVRPPRLGGNRRMGVFATRSTFRPNPIGLSSVRLERIFIDPENGPVIEVSGADLMDGTPVFDIKPYIEYADSHPGASAGWLDTLTEHHLKVEWTPEAEASALAAGCGKDTAAAIEEILSLDPRPAYIDDPEREYGILYSGFNVRFRVCGSTLTVMTVCFNNMNCGHQ